MAIVHNTSDDATLLAALGGSLSAGDSVYLSRDQKPFTDADVSGTDLLLFEVGPEFRQDVWDERFTLTLNRTATGVFRNNSRSRRVYVESTSSAGVIHNVYHKPLSGGMLRLGSMNTELAVAAGGSMTLAAGCDCAVARFFSASGRIEYDSGSFGMPTLQAYGDGVIELQRAVATLLEVNDAQRVRVTRSEATLANPKVLSERATLELVDCGAISNLVVLGLLDLSNLSRPVTITNYTFGQPVVVGGRAVGGARVRWPRSGPDLITWAGTGTFLGDDDPRDYAA